VTQDDSSRLARAFRHAGIDARPREDCPDPDRIWAAVRLELPLDERMAIVDHTTTCPVCAEAWRIAMALREGDASGRAWWRRRHLGLPVWARVAAAVLVLGAGIALALRFWPGTDDPVRPPRAATVFALRDGNGQVTLTAEGRVEGLPALPPAERGRVESALLARRFEPTPDVQALAEAHAALMGPGERKRFGVLAPVGTAIEVERPLFQWQPLSGARGYRVVVSDPAAGYRVIEESPETHATTWSATQPLARGRMYVWQVVARTKAGEMKAPAPDEPEARFKVLEPDRADALAQARERYAGWHLVLASLYYDAGVVDRAREELEALVADNPTSPEVRALLASVREPPRRDQYPLPTTTKPAQ
jgi:hypothetical protein